MKLGIWLYVQLRPIYVFNTPLTTQVFCDGVFGCCLLAHHDQLSYFINFKIEYNKCT